MQPEGEARSSMLKVLHEIWREGGPSAMFRGASPLVLRGALFSAGQTLGYDGTKTALSQRNNIMQDGPGLHLLGSVVAAFFASTFSAPADFIMVRYQSAPQMGIKYTGPLDCLKQVVSENGVMVVYRGWTPYFCRILPVFLIYHPMYEQFRALVGLTYFK